MFQLNGVKVKIASANPRAEKHGDENVLAVDLKVELTGGNDLLDSFSKRLRPALYRTPDSGDQIDLMNPAGMTVVNFPRIESLSWDEEFPGYECEISRGEDSGEPIFLPDVTLRKFKFEPLEGGSVAISFSLLLHPEAGEAGELCALIQSDVELTLTPPSKPVQAANDHLEQAADALAA